MKKKFLLIALIAVILTVGMVLVSCGGNCPGDGKCSLKAGAELKYCGDKIKDQKTLKQAMECQVYVNAQKSKAGECDC